MITHANNIHSAIYKNISRPLSVIEILCGSCVKVFTYSGNVKAIRVIENGFCEYCNNTGLNPLPFTEVF